MKQHEREFFIYQLRTGKVLLEQDIVIHPPTIDQNLQACIIYNRAYDEAIEDGFMTPDAMFEWLMERGLWSGTDEGRVKFLTKDVETFRLEMYENRHEKRKYNRIRMYLRKAEKELTKSLTKKHSYYENTCAGVAQTEKIAWTIKNTCFKSGKPYDFEEVGLERVMNWWQLSARSEQETRDLVRNEPWSSLWNVASKSQTKLFENDELTLAQKNLLVWSQTYDNVQESMDCPPPFVIEDDDLLDGWFVKQSKKRAEEKKKEDLDEKLGKNADKQEVFLMAQKEDTEQIGYIGDLNDPKSKAIKKSRTDTILTAGEGVRTKHQDLPDVKRELQIEANKLAMERMKNG